MSLSEPLRQIEECRSLAHKVFRARWDSPSANLTQIAHDLKRDYSTVAKAWERLTKRPDFGKLCPICFEGKRYGLICHSCGAELDQAIPLEIDFDSQSPVYRIQPFGGLGSVTNYGLVSKRMKLNNVGAVLQQQVERHFHSPFEATKKELMQWLKGFTPSASITDSAFRLLAQEFGAFRARYPSVKITFKIREQLLENTQRRLALAYPSIAVQVSNSNGGSGKP